MAIQQQQIQQPVEQQWQPQFDKAQTRRLTKVYKESPARFKEQDLEEIRRHAQYYNVPFYEGEFSLYGAIKQAAGGLLEGFTTLRTVDPPDNEYEAIARNLGHLVGFVPGILSGPLKSIGLVNSAKALAGVKSVPMWVADKVTKQAKKIVKPALKGAKESQFGAANTASKFLMGHQAKHMAEGAFHLGTASAVSSVWDGVDQMMHSFFGGAIAGGVFRGLGNIWTGQGGADKVARQIAGGVFMGLPETIRGATTAEQIYQYLIGAYFGGKEQPWFRAKAMQGLKEFDKQTEKDPRLEWTKDIKRMEGFEEYPEIVRNEMVRIVEEGFDGRGGFGKPKDRERMGYELMEMLGITENIPKEKLDTDGYKALNRYVKGRQIQTRYKAVDNIGVAISGAGSGSDATWSVKAMKRGLPTIHMIPESSKDPLPMKSFYNLRDKGRIRGVERGLKDPDLMEAGPYVEQANQTLKRPIEKYTDKQLQYVFRNYHQIKNAGSIYAIGEITTKGNNAGRTVKGNTGWAVQMGIDKGMNGIFVYDPVQRGWHQWNAGKNRFERLDGVPKLRRNPALIGTRGDIKYKDQSGRKRQRLSDHVKQAMEDVLDVTFGKEGAVKTTPVKGAVPVGSIKEYHKQTLKNINSLRDEIDVKKQDIRDIDKALKEGNVDKVRIKELNKQKKELQKSIDDMYKEIVDKHQVLSPYQFYHPITGKLEEDLDIGMGGSEFALMKKSEYFSNKYLDKLWSEKEGIFSQRDRMLELGREVQTMLENYVEKGNKNIKINELVNDIESAFSTKSKKFNLSPEGKNHLRNWLRELNLGKQVIFVKTKGGTKIELSDPSRPTSASGVTRLQTEPPKLVEEIYEIEGGKLDTGGAPVVIFDSVSRSKKNGLSADIPLERLNNHFRFTEGNSQDMANKKVQGVVGRVINEMMNKYNLYPLGGQGDKGRIVFVKLHPKSRKVSEYRKQYIDLIKALRKRKKDGKYTDLDAYSLLKQDMKSMKNEYGVSNEKFKQMLASNLMYELSLNGYKNTPQNINTIMGEGFIPSAIQFNKRHQIWMTNGYGGNKEFFKSGDGKIDDLSPEGNFLYRLIQDPDTPKDLKDLALKLNNIQLPEHVDGAILGRSDWVKSINKDAGHPKSGQNKSFIIDNTPDSKGNNMGALLGKYMIHDVGPEASTAMKKQGLHMMVMTSAAKQTGTRKVGNYDVAKDGSLMLKGGETYELNPESIKYTNSVINDSHMLQSQIWVKQLFTNLHQFSYAPISKDIINDIHREITVKSFNGNDTVNKVAREYIKDLDPAKIDYLLRNIEDMGTNQLIELLKTPGAEVFSERAMQQMLRVVEKDIQAQFMEGEISSEQRFKALSELSEAVSPIDRLLKNVSIVSEQANAQGKTGFSGYLHKFVRDYRASVLHNYFVKRITRPKTDNSAVARIRPYDKWMQKDFKELNTRDDIFYLDNAYKDTRIKLSDGRIKTLGELWESKDPAHKDIFNALVLRVPMDSISGAHKLEFKGFTGREGHGIMMHGRTMRALGGADLDGDEAFIYFGGKKEDGTGFGMKKSWMDAIMANKGEYYNKNKTNVTDNKGGLITTGPYKGKTYRDLLTLNPSEEQPMKVKKSLYFSPYSRLKASQGAVEGRNMLGIAVVNGQTMKSAYSSIMEADGQKDTFDFFKRGWYRVTVTPKKGKNAEKYQRELTRAQIAFGSDPLDEGGLKSPETFFHTLYNSYFDISVKRKNPITKKWENVKSEYNTSDNTHVIEVPFKNKKTGKIETRSVELTPGNLKNGILGYLTNMNSAYFSRNYTEGRRHTMDEVNHMASDIRFFTENQKNTMLPKIVDKLDGLDWSDNLFNRVDRGAIETLYKEVDAMVLDKKGKFGKWLKDALGRGTFRVKYNDHIDAVVKHELHDKSVRHQIANDSTPEGLKRFIEVTKHSVFGKEFQIYKNDFKIDKQGNLQLIRNKLRKLYNYREKIQVLEQMSRQAEDFLSNDIATMATLMSIKKILDKKRISTAKIKDIFKTVNQFKKKSYLQRDERRELDFNAYLEGPKDKAQRQEIDSFLKELYDKMGIKRTKKDLVGDTRSASWDQMELDANIRSYKSKLNKSEQELFDHLFLGTLQRGNLNKINKYMDLLAQKKNSPVIRDLVWRLIQDASKTGQTRLGLNSEAISDVSIQNYFKEMNDLHLKTWKPMSEKESNKIAKESSDTIDNIKPREPKIVDEMVQGAHKGEGYAGLSKGDLKESDKKLITDIAVLLKKYNNKIGNEVDALNNAIRGITSTLDPDARGKDLNTLNRQDFKNILSYLKDISHGTMFQSYMQKKPELQKRYYSLFPETLDREMMKYDIEWLQKEGWFVSKMGDLKKGVMDRPTSFLGMFQNIISKNSEMATGKAEQIYKEIENEFNHLQEIKEGNGLFKIAVAQMESGIKEDINKLDEPESIKKHYRLVYDILRGDTEKEFNWKKIKDKEFTLLNDAAERVKVTGNEIVNGSKEKGLTGIKSKIAKKFEEMHKIIQGDSEAFKRYTTGRYFDPESRLQPRMNWELFVKDMTTALEKGDIIPMELGVDGMRHIMRSMMYDLAPTKEQKQLYKNWEIKRTGKIPFERYWPHMFHDKNTAEKSIRNALEFIRNDSSLTPEQKRKAIQKVVLRHHTISDEWTPQEMQDWDKVDVLEFNQGLKDIAVKKKKSKELVRWTDMNPSFSSLFSRKGHIPGWSTDINVMNAYAKNLTDTYYRQISHIMSRQVLDMAKKQMSKKYGWELTNRWQRFFKLWVQGAMGQPEVIPERWYEDPKMKLKGTPYAWFADNRILDRVNKIRKKLGIRESDLPEELKNFDFNDLRHWSNMEAKFELASLLAHPKSAITNIWGGSLHTIASAGPGTLKKARDIKWLKRINPEWNSMQDVQDWAVKKGVLPEFMIHELGLGKEVKGNLSGFIGELSKKINSPNEKISRAEVFSIGKKHGLSDAVMSQAAKFMSIPERMLRRDSFMAHYVRAWERFGGAIKDPNHPFLIETAKKGVKMTQFLYDAPNRPMFARSAVGKIMSRFQLFAWNSVRFRNDVLRNAKMYGFKPGTESYKRFVRMAQIDLFQIALANMFMYSLFDNALPQPWSWFQDLSNWMLGNEKERDKAFFGQWPAAIAPLQMITPPIARFPVSGLMQWARDDYTKFTDYQMYTAMPFGRLVRDIIQPEKGLIDNPSRFLEKMAGMPIRDVQKFTTQRKKDLESGERYRQTKPGIRYGEY